MQVEGFVRRLQPVDLSRIQVLLEKLTEEMFVTGDAVRDRSYRGFTSAKHIMFRYPVVGVDQAPYRQPFWDLFRDDVEPWFRETAEFFGCESYETSRIVIAQVQPDGRIERHKDNDFDLHTAHRVHVPLQTHPDAVMTFNKGVAHHLSVGHAWEVHNTGYHGVRNPTPVPRIHLYFDLILPRSEMPHP